MRITGHTNTLIDISPYKFDGPGGRDANPGCTWRRLRMIIAGYRRAEADVGSKYAQHVGDIIGAARKRGARFARLSRRHCKRAGQIVFPPGLFEASLSVLCARRAVCALRTKCKSDSGRLAHTFGVRDAGRGARYRGVGQADRERLSLAAVITTPEIAASVAMG